MPDTSRFDKYIQRARELGAEDAKIVPSEDVITAEWVLLKCTYGCGAYGRCLMCPPYSPRPEQTRRTLDCYEHVLLVHCKAGRNVKQLVVTLEREIFLEGYYKALALGAGPCGLCDECDTEGLCQHPREARPAMEASGIDVFATARSAGLPIEVARDRDCDQDHYGIVMIE
ncbi:MAG: DUF2284 domain-containing protein [Armatimonadota bacterium]